jgi:PAS domain S-box-containing protein
MSLATQTTPLIAALEQLGPHDHFCSIYESPQEHYAVAIPFIRIGLDRGEKCIYIADDGADGDVRQAMQSEGIDVDSAIASKALVLATKDQTYLKHGSFHPDWMFTFWKETTELAMGEGFSALRATGETEWVLRGSRGLERWMEYESRLTHTLSESNCSALCQYNRHLFPPEVILDVIRTHPTIVYGGAVCRNLYFVPPEEFLGANQTAREVERLLTNIRERERVDNALRVQLTERRRTEEALRRSERYLAEAQRLSHTGSWALSANSKIAVYWSEEDFRIWGFDPRQGLPDTEMVFQRIHPGDAGRVYEKSMKALGEKTDYTDEFRIVLSDGEVKHIHTLAHPVLGANGEIAEYVGTHVDVTERKRAEAEQKRAAEALRQAQEDLARVSRVTTMGELTASLAHEVNQPITASVTNARTCVRWLAGDAPNIEEARDAAMRSAKNGTRAAEIIGRIRLLFQKGTPQRELVDVNEVIREIIVLLRSEATRYSISVRTELGTGFPELIGDSVQLQQVFMNLLLNGIEAMKDVAGRRELSVKSQMAKDEQLLISISDTGSGLPPQANQIFDAFFTTKLHGTGMGLSISRSIVESHGGRLWAADNAPRGATFHITLPIRVEAL